MAPDIWNKAIDVVVYPTGLALLYWIGGLIREQGRAVLAAAKLVPQIAMDVQEIKQAVDHHGVSIMEHGERISYLEGKGNGSTAKL